MTKQAKTTHPASYADLPFPDGAPGFSIGPSWAKMSAAEPQFSFCGTNLALSDSNRWLPKERAVVAAVATQHYEDILRGTPVGEIYYPEIISAHCVWDGERKAALLEFTRAKRAAKRALRKERNHERRHDRRELRQTVYERALRTDPAR